MGSIAGISAVSAAAFARSETVGTQQAPSPAGPKTPAQNSQLHESVRQLNGVKAFGDANELTFVIDRTTHRPLLRVVNRETKEVVMQIPPEYAVRLAEELSKSDKA